MITVLMMQQMTAKEVVIENGKRSQRKSIKRRIQKRVRPREGERKEKGITTAVVVMIHTVQLTRMIGGRIETGVVRNLTILLSAMKIGRGKEKENLGIMIVIVGRTHPGAEIGIERKAKRGQNTGLDLAQSVQSDSFI